MERIDELEVKTHFDLQQAISDLKFWWNLAQHKGLPIHMVILGSPSVRGGKSIAFAKREGEISG
jgi:hypothetical protein